MLAITKPDTWAMQEMVCKWCKLWFLLQVVRVQLELQWAESLPPQDGIKHKTSLVCCNPTVFSMINMNLVSGHCGGGQNKEWPRMQGTPAYLIGGLSAKKRKQFPIQSDSATKNFLFHKNIFPFQKNKNLFQRRKLNIFSLGVLQKKTLGRRGFHGKFIKLPSPNKIQQVQVRDDNVPHCKPGFWHAPI